MKFKRQNVGVKMKAYSAWQKPSAIRKWDFPHVNTRELASSSTGVDREKADEFNFLPTNIVFSDDQIYKWFNMLNMVS